MAKQLFKDVLHIAGNCQAHTLQYCLLNNLLVLKAEFSIRNVLTSYSNFLPFNKMTLQRLPDNDVKLSKSDHPHTNKNWSLGGVVVFFKKRQKLTKQYTLLIATLMGPSY